MNYIEIKASVKILMHVLEKKTELMETIYNITVNQNAVLVSEDYDESMFKLLMKEKEYKINEINELDERFQKIFDSVKQHMIQNKDEYKEHIKKIQDRIKSNMDLKMRIQLQEQKNKEIIEKRVI